MDNYEFNLVGSETYEFIWNDFCSSYIEFSKFTSDSIGTKSVLCYVLTGILKILHPFMPFVTEEIYGMLPIKDSESIMISSYPVVDNNFIFNDEYNKVEEKIGFISSFRNIKAENDIDKTAKVKLNIKDDIIIKMLKLAENIIETEENIKSYNVVYGRYEGIIYFEKQLTEEDIKLKEKQINDLKNSIERRQKLLSNENYVSKAPKNLVEEEKNKLNEEINQLSLLENC